mmetsp:Transcript_9396/g.40750  ORF Transcript_9396/g.40750 Transcript_9396/m.40750 type:complete len:344 (+) Transcript_9396:154-1185(+)
MNFGRGALGFGLNVNVRSGRGRTRAVCVTRIGDDVPAGFSDSVPGRGQESVSGQQDQTGKRRRAKSGGKTKYYRRKPRTKLAELEVGKEVTGVVKNFVDWGAYVSIGAERDGLLHVRDMSLDFVTRPQDVLKEGEKVKVFIKYVDPEKSTLGLSMVGRPVLEKRLRVEDVREGDRFEGIVVRISNFGVFVDIGCEVDGFLHVTDLWGDRKRETLDNLRYNTKLDVIVAESESAGGKLRLRLAKLPESVDRKGVGYGQSFGASVPASVVFARPGDPPVEESNPGDDFDFDDWDADFEDDAQAQEIRDDIESEVESHEGDLGVVEDMVEADPLDEVVHTGESATK